MTYVDKIVTVFGGVRPMAKLLSLPPTTVSSWKVRGSIPDRQKALVLTVSDREGFNLSPADFFPLESLTEDAA
jgi:hypothetical protein